MRRGAAKHGAVRRCTATHRTQTHPAWTHFKNGRMAAVCRTTASEPCYFEWQATAWHAM